MVNYF